MLFVCVVDSSCAGGVVEFICSSGRLCCILSFCYGLFSVVFSWFNCFGGLLAVLSSVRFL